jgi:hypothetical protein
MRTAIARTACLSGVFATALACGQIGGQAPLPTAPSSTGASAVGPQSPATGPIESNPRATSPTARPSSPYTPAGTPVTVSVPEGWSRTTVGAATVFTDIASTRAKVGSTLTAVDLAGLTRVEPGSALLLCSRPVPADSCRRRGLNERRRSFAVARALGARRTHLRAFLAGRPRW